MGEGEAVKAAGTPLLERERELATLREVLDASQDGSGRLAVITGPAGIGKSRLLAEMAIEARRGRTRILASRCQSLEQELSFAVALQLFARAWAERKGNRGSAADAAAPLFAERLPGAPADPFPLLHGLYWLCAEAAEDGPLFLAVDDAHWADPSSLRFLNYLASRIDELPVALVVTSREGEAAGERAALLAEVEAAAATPIRLAPLSADAVTAFVRDSIPRASDRFCAACEDATGGNPFLLGELVAELRMEGVAGDDADAERVGAIAPAGIRRTTLLRLGRLGDPAIEVAKAIAVLADDAEIRHIAALAGVETATAATAAELLVRTGVLTDGKLLEFAHPLLATAIRAEIAAPRREQMHRTAARRLAAEGASAERIAAHLLRAARESSEWTVEILRRAAQQALARGSPESAARYLGRALEEPPGDMRGRVTLELGIAEARAGSPASVDRLREASDLLSDPAERARALHALARALYARGRIPDAAGAFRDAAATAAGHDPRLEMGSEAEFLPIGLLVESHLPEVLERVPSALERIGERPQSAAERAIVGVGGLVAVMTAQPYTEALRLAECALDHGRLLAEDGAEGTALSSVTATLTLCGALNRSIAVLAEAIARASRDGSVMGFATASYCRSHPLWWRGSLSEAIADVEAALEVGWEQYLPVAYGIYVSALVERGEFERAAAVAHRLDHERWGSEPMYGFFLQGRARLGLATGDFEAAFADAERVGEIWSAPNPAFYGEWRSLAAQALAPLGERERAIELATEELELVRPFGAPRAVGVALHAQGVARGGEEGIGSLQEAVAIFDRSEARLELCRALVDLGGMIRRAGRRAEAREILRRGLDMAGRGEMVALERRADEELKLAGGRPRSRFASGVEALTPGELRVARMAAEGMTNREIAQALFVTIKAVQYHLGNTYRKLDIGSRDELAEALEPDAAAVTA